MVLQLFLSVALALCFAGCGNIKTKYTDYSFECFDTVTTIIGYEESKEEFDAVCNDIKSLLMKYHRLYDIYNEYEGINNICSVNYAKEPLKVDAEIIELLEFSKEMHIISDGRVNVAMGSVLELWHQYREEGKELPPEDMLKEAGSHIDINDVIIDKTEGTVFLQDPQMSLDVGAGMPMDEYASDMDAPEEPVGGPDA